MIEGPCRQVEAAEGHRQSPKGKRVGIVQLQMKHRRNADAEGRPARASTFRAGLGTRDGARRLHCEAGTHSSHTQCQVWTVPTADKQTSRGRADTICTQIRSHWPAARSETGGAVGDPRTPVTWVYSSTSLSTAIRGLLCLCTSF